MPISFKPAITATFHKLTPTEDLVPCAVCGGPNLMGKVARNVSCTHCGGTGYDNYYSEISLPAYYTPRALTRWTGTEAGVVKFGDAQIKLDARYSDIVYDAKYVTVNGLDWNLQRVRDPGVALGQARVILALSKR